MSKHTHTAPAAAQAPALQRKCCDDGALHLKKLCAVKSRRSPEAQKPHNCRWQVQRSTRLITNAAMQHPNASGCSRSLPALTRTASLAAPPNTRSNRPNYCHHDRHTCLCTTIASFALCPTLMITPNTMMKGASTLHAGTQLELDGQACTTAPTKQAPSRRGPGPNSRQHNAQHSGLDSLAQSWAATRSRGRAYTKPPWGTGTMG